MRDAYLFKPADIPDGYSEHWLLQGEIIELFTGIKKSRKLLADNAERDIRSKLDQISKTKLADPDAEKNRVGQIHSQLHWYEQTYLHIGGDWGRFQGALKLRYPTTVELVKSVGQTYQLNGIRNGRRLLLGTIHVNDDRFELLPVQPNGRRADVYQRIGKPGRHYIKLATSNTFVRRFVFRGLNAGDIMAIAQRQSLTATFLQDKVNKPETDSPNRFRYPNDHVLTVDEQILSHTRGCPNYL